MQSVDIFQVLTFTGYAYPHGKAAVCLNLGTSLLLYLWSLPSSHCGTIATMQLCVLGFVLPLLLYH